jgi:3-hydroxy-9,10-secoandrosta-1,3,5(10)-triene-9,17-dione monooxygenase reductase component
MGHRLRCCRGSPVRCQPMASTSIDVARFREVLGHFASGVTVVTGLSEHREPIGFTCQAFAALSLDPPMVLLAPGKSSTTWPRIAQAGAFCVNILASDQEALARSFAVSGGNKFSGVAWEPGPETGAPLLEGVVAWVECELGDIFDAGDHELVTGRVLALGVGRGQPLLFYRGGFGTFSP